MSLVNIILPVYNRPEHTKQTLDSLYKNTPWDLFDLTVIDDCSDKETQDVLYTLHQQYGFNLHIKAENTGPGDSRNIGARLVTELKSRGKYLYHCDNDVYYKENWLQRLVMSYQVASTDGIALLGASCHPYLQNNEVRRYTNPNTLETTGLEAAISEIQVGIKDAVSGYSQLMSWEIWDRFGEYHTQLGLEKKTGRSDDWEYCQRIKADGFEVGSVEPELVIPCGKTDTYGDPAVGQETFKNHEGVLIQ